MAINAEKLYENAKEALRLACEAQDVSFEYVTKNPDAFVKTFPDIVPALTVYLMAKDELGKAKGGSAYNAVKRIVKNVPDVRSNLKGVWTDAEGRQCVCDAYRAIRLAQPVEGFETVEGMDLSKVYPPDERFECELTLPTPGELKINKKKLSYNAYGYDFGEGLPMVNAAYLKDIMDILPDAKAYATNNPWRGDNRVLSSPIVFRSEKGDAILLPVRKMSA